MSSQLTINVTNRSSSTQTFYFFQQPAIFSGGQQVYSNSLFSQALGNYDQTGAILTFQTVFQPFACIQQASHPPQVGAASGYSSAIRAMDLATNAGGNDSTNASVNPLGLAPAVNMPGVQPGAFRMITPAYQPQEIYNLGQAVQVNGQVSLSSFVSAMPNYLVDCQPVLKFYVQTGSYTPGAVINFSQSSVNAAWCDFTGGFSVINVTLNPDGTWTTQMVQ